MRIAVCMLAYNCLDLSKRTVESIWKQDVSCPVFVVNNASTDGTKEWLDSEGIRHFDSTYNLGITAGWNYGLSVLFNDDGFDFVLIPNNDVVLPPWFASELASYDVPLVTGFEVTTMDEIAQKLPRIDLVPYPDFSAYMIRKDCWDKVGAFDERMFNYASDCDYHVRAYRAGLFMGKANVQYYHERSSHINRAPNDQEKNRLMAIGDEDREVFKSIYGCLPGTKEYLALLGLV